MASVYARGKRLWARLKGVKVPGKWDAVPTPYNVGQETDAEAFVKKSQALLDKKNAGDAAGIRTVADWAEKWLAARSERGLASFRDDVGRIKNHVLPLIGDVRLGELKMIHVRDMMRKLQQNPDLSPRTILNIYGVCSTMLHDAQREGLVHGTPWDLPLAEKPEKSDKDPEWRDLATWETAEVVALISDPRIPVERRVQNALKALGGLRHGEAAGLRWRNYDRDTKPLGKLIVARSYNNRRTKTEVTRPVPVVPLLARILETWRAEHWPKRHGRDPKPDDLIVATRAGRLVSAHYAGETFKEDLARLGLRVDAGEHRDRGGHDLRAWFITTCKENGANPEDVARITHTKKKDVTSGYTRTKWPAMCAAAEKLGIVVDGDPLSLATGLVTATGSNDGDERMSATPTGFEPVSMSTRVRSRARKGPKPAGRRAHHVTRESISVRSDSTARRSAKLTPRRGLP